MLSGVLRSKKAIQVNILIMRAFVQLRHMISTNEELARKLVWMRVRRPDDIWYNGRAVAESVQTRTWRWMMRAGPYKDSDDLETMRKKFLADIKAILIQNQDLAAELCNTEILQDSITPKMIQVRALPVAGRLGIYRQDRIQDQAEGNPSIRNRSSTNSW